MTETPTAQPTSRPARHAAQVALIAILAYVAFSLMLPLVHIPRVRLSLATILALVVIPTALFMLLQLWLSRALVGLAPRPWVCLILMALSVGGWFLLLPHPHHPPHSLAEILLRSLGSNLAITIGCTFFGILLSGIVREANILLPVAFISMPIDYIGAMTPVGFTHDVMKKDPTIVQHVSISVPAIGGLHPISYIGPGDALFMAFFFAVVQRLTMNERGTFWGMYGLLTATMLLIVLSPWPLNIAALVPMGLAVLIANVRFFRLKRSEAFAVLYASLLVLAVIVGFFLYSHALFSHH